ncbi:hypothetical protein ACFS5N_16770 [Mucilaginibacter ximonensis]|uniref:Peptidase S74 domain-containing protein n=1 Tax=Mucilaginibacter ximonensis TaxID=538021 RepID=A0ABW5YFI4_9SPHI
MKKAISLVAVVFIGHCAFAQTNNFPPSGNVGIGTYTPAVKTHILSTTEQLRLAYDSTHYSTFTTSSAGNLLFKPSGGHLGLGGIQIATGLYNSLAMTGASTAYGLYGAGVIQSDVTTTGTYFVTGASTAAASFTLPNLYHYLSSQGTFGAGSTVTNQYGFTVSSTMVGATNNFGFYGSIPAGTGRWNLYMPGTANNYLAGQLSIGTTNTSTAPLYVTLAGITAAGVTRGAYLAQSLGATSNGSSQVALDISPTFTNSGTGILNFGSLTGGSGYANGTYTNVPLTGGTGSGALASITVSGGAVTSTGVTTNGTGYTVGDVLSAAASFDSIGAGSGFSITVTGLGYTSVHNYAIRSLTNGYVQIGGNMSQGVTTQSNINLYLGKILTGSSSAYGVYSTNVIQPDVSTAYLFLTAPGTASSNFNLTNLYHYSASQSTIGTGSSITTQAGFTATNSLIGAANNYGFLGNIPAGTGRWNLYMAGNAANYIGGNLGVATTTPIAKLQVGSASASAWGSISPMLFVSGTAIDNSTATGATVSGITTTQFTLGPHALTASNGTSGSPVTYTTAATMYIAGAPSPGANTIITSPYALYINSGDSFFNGTKNSFSGKILIGTTTARDEMLSVNGNIRARQIKIETANWPDYVFASQYTLPNLSDLKAYIDKNKHLPDMPSEKEIAADGQNLGEINKVLVKKVEELTLYLIEKDKQLKQQEENAKIQQQQINLLSKQVEAINKIIQKN